MPKRARKGVIARKQTFLQPRNVAQLQPLSEGPAPIAPSTASLQSSAPSARYSTPPPSTRSDIPGAVLPYGRGSKELALNIAKDPAMFSEAMDNLKKDINAASNAGTRDQKIATWSQLAQARGFADPFKLTPQLISKVAACLKAAGYRSVPAYLSLAKQEFARRLLEGAALPEEILLAIREASRSARRGLGPAKHTGKLPFLRLSELKFFASEPRDNEPAHPLATMVLACWYLMREIEVADLQVRHV